MTIFYRGHCVRITHQVLEIRCPFPRSFAIRDLRHVQVAERATDPPVLSAVRLGSTGVAGATAVTVGVGWPALDSSPPLALVALGLLALSAAVSGACWGVRRIRYELIAVCRDRPVLLFRSSDTRVFGQVTRALARAIEARGG